MAVNTNELSAVVLQHIDSKVVDGMARFTKLTEILTKDGLKKQNGGTYLQCPIKLIANSTMGNISGTSAAIDMSPAIQLQYMVFNWKYHVTPVGFTLEDYNIATGPDQIVDFMEEKIKGAAEDTIRQFSKQFNGTSSGAALNFEGLKDIVAASGTAYGGLTDTDYLDADGNSTLFLPKIFTDIATINQANAARMINAVRARYTPSDSKKKLIMLMNPDIYSKFETAIQAQRMIVDVSEDVEAGLTGFKFNGAFVYMDVDAPGSGAGTADNYVTVFPEEIMKFWYNFGFGSKSPFDGEARIPNQVIKSMQKFTTGNMICTNRRAIAVSKVVA